MNSIKGKFHDIETFSANINSQHFFFFFSILGRMSVDDQKFFPSDASKYNWNEYRYNYYLGLLRYIGLETLDDFAPAKSRMMKFKIAHFFVLIIYYAILASIYYFIGHLLGINDTIRAWIARIHFSK